MIETRGLAKSFGDRTALQPLDLEVQAGGIVGLLGPNGSGKSTLLRLLVGLVPRERGRARVAGVELEGDGTRVRERVAYAPGEIALYGELTGAATLDFLLRGRHDPARERGVHLARRLGLPLDRRVRGYSHGMKRQLMVAAALAPAVPLRLLDEPSEGLDPQKRGALLALLAEDAAAGTTIVLSSHHLGEVESACTRLLFLNQGRLIADESAAALAGRAARIVRVSFERGTTDAPSRAAQIGAALAGIAGAGTVKVRPVGSAAVGESAPGGDLVFTCELAAGDPRPFLGALAALPGLPVPRAVRHGELSLSELYRELYGVEVV